MFKETRVYPEFFIFWKQEGNSWWLIRVRAREKKWICCLFCTISYCVSCHNLESNHGLLTPCVLSHFSQFWLFMTLWTVARQASLSTGFSRQEYWSEFMSLPCPPAGDLPDPGIKPTSLMSPVFASGFFTTNTTPVKIKSLLIWVVWQDKHLDQ